MGDDDDVVEVPCRPEGFEHLEQRLVDDDHLVLGIVDDVGELVGEQPGVQGVDDRAHRGDREIQLQVLALVPQQRGHRVSLADAERGQRAGKATGATGARAERGAINRTRRPP